MTVYDVVLLPSAPIRQRSASTSEDLSKRHKTDFTLKEGSVEPHLSLYMAEMNVKSERAAKRKLAKIAKQTGQLPLQASRYGHNFQEGMFEVFYHKTPDVTALQERLLDKVSPLRSRRWPERNPVGHVLDEWVPRQGNEARENLEKYGYEEIGDLFKPHITFTRFSQRDLETDVHQLPALSAFDDTFSTLALYKMGENGTCIEPVASYELPTEPKRGLLSALKDKINNIRSGTKH